MRLASRKNAPLSPSSAQQVRTMKDSAVRAEESCAVRILRLPQVCEVTGLCRSMIYQMEAESRFPGRIKIGTRAVGWLEGDVRTWLIGRVEASRTRNSPNCSKVRQRDRN
jgi:prophage regulatory protein